MVKSHNPNYGYNNLVANVSWPVLDVANDLNMILDVPNSIEKNLYAGACDFWDTFLYAENEKK